MTIGFIEDCIRRARNHDSGLDASVLEVPGFSTGVMRRLWNNLCVEANSYLEVGAYFGGTACAAMNNNRHLKTYIFEDGSQEFHGRPIIEELKANITKHRSGEVTLMQDDFFLFSLSELKDIDFYFYDGNHNRDFQANALPRAFPSLANQFLFAVDDFNWDSVRMGTEDGFSTLCGPWIRPIDTGAETVDLSAYQLGGSLILPPGLEYQLNGAMKVVHSWHLRGQQLQDDKIWHNGVGLFLCEKL